MKRVLVAMSGGVDSSVAAALLVEQGYEVIGVTMQLWDYTKNNSGGSTFDTCCSLDDVADARLVAHKLGISFYVFDYQSEFQTNVVDYFTKSYLEGQTPNPCVACNTFLKFDHLLDRARRLNCSYVATGHYARIQYDSHADTYRLLKGVDRNKDQSYFLYGLPQEKLKMVMFPLGDLEKNEVRRLAEKYDLATAHKKESMEICFIPNNDYAKFIENNSDPKDIIKGDLKHESGKWLGTHDGIHKFTIGQRKGLGIATGETLYVTKIDPSCGTVWLGNKESMGTSKFSLRNFHEIIPCNPGEDYEVKIRYRSEIFVAQLEQDKTSISLKNRVATVTPGQIAVLYRGDEVCGGGFIDQVGP